MKAAVYDRYGSPDVVRIEEVPVPAPGPGEILVKLHASSVTTADWRLRASAFPGGLWLPGRLVAGLFRPKNRVLGSDFAGVVSAVGAGVTGFAVGDAVYGFAGSGAHAEYLTVPETGAVAPIPEGLGFAEAAALPFGMLAAWQFLTRFAGVKPGDRVLVVGASGGVGAYAVQVAKALGAHVTGVASGDNHALIRDLGADEVIDYRNEDALAGRARYDLVFDAVGATRWRRVRRALKPGGTYVPLNFGLGDILPALLPHRQGKRMVIGVNADTREDLDRLAPMLEAGEIRPVVDRRYPLARIRAAHAHVEGRHRSGAVVLEIAGESDARAA